VLHSPSDLARHLTGTTTPSQITVVVGGSPPPGISLVTYGLLPITLTESDSQLCSEDSAVSTVLSRALRVVCHSLHSAPDGVSLDPPLRGYAPLHRDPQGYSCRFADLKVLGDDDPVMAVTL
jgi:hypothetical protein